MNTYLGLANCDFQNTHNSNKQTLVFNALKWITVPSIACLSTSTHCNEYLFTCSCAVQHLTASYNAINLHWLNMLESKSTFICKHSSSLPLLMQLIL